MLKKVVSLFIGIIFLGITACFAADGVPGKGMPVQDLEWSDYGLNFEWAKDNKLLKELELTVQQKEELGKLAETSGQTTKKEEDILDKKTQLKRQIEIKSLIKINGQYVQPDQIEIKALIEQISKLENEQYMTRMEAKAQLRMLLTEKQREVLFSHFQKKEKEIRDKFREQMKDQIGERGRYGRHGRRYGSPGRFILIVEVDNE
jgi:Spy/CpxP family protein refolding chaperone